MPYTTLGSATAGQVYTAAAHNAIIANLNTLGPTVFNVQTAVKSDTASTTSATFVDIGISLTITPSSASSKILLMANVNLGINQSANNHYGMFRFMRGSTAIGVGDAASTRQQASSQAMTSGTIAQQYAGMVFIDSPATTSATTYKLQWLVPGGATLYLNRADSDPDSTSRNRSISTLTAIEVPV